MTVEHLVHLVLWHGLLYECEGQCPIVAAMVAKHSAPSDKSAPAKPEALLGTSRITWQVITHRTERYSSRNYIATATECFMPAMPLVLRKDAKLRRL
jgi:hypothetical protein